MSESVDLATLVKQPFELLQEIERRSRQAHSGQSSAAMPDEWVGVGFRIGEEQFVAVHALCRVVVGQACGIEARQVAGAGYQHAVGHGP